MPAYPTGTVQTPHDYCGSIPSDTEEDPVDHYIRHRDHDRLFGHVDDEPRTSPLTTPQIALVLLALCVLLASLAYLLISGVRVHDEKGEDVTVAVVVCLSVICVIYTAIVVKNAATWYSTARGY